MKYQPSSLSSGVILGLVSMMLLARLLVLGDYPLMDPTEGRYAEIAREMVSTGEWIVPHIEQDNPFWGKPPLMFWVMATCYSWFGFSEFSARLPSYLLSCLTLLLVYFFVKRLQGPFAAALSVLFLSSMALFYSYAGFVAVDTSLLVTVASAQIFFLSSVLSSSRFRQRANAYLFFISLGLSLLAKGLVGAVLILGPVFCWILWNREFDFARRFPWFSGLILTAAVAVPWHIACEMRTPGFLEYYIVGEHWKRFTVSNWEGDRYGSPHQFPRGTILLFFLGTALPWSLVFLGMTIRRRAFGAVLRNLLDNRIDSFLLFWFSIPLAFFSLSRNVMFTYTLPCLPPFAILLARSGFGGSDGRTPQFLRSLPPNLVGGLSILMPAIFLLAAQFFIPHLGDSRSQKELASHFLSLDVDRDAHLVYTDRMPFSGDFYTGGRAIDIPDEDPLEILYHLDSPHQDYFAIKLNDLDNFPYEGFERTVEVGRFGNYILRRELDPSDLPLEFVSIADSNGDPVSDETFPMRDWQIDYSPTLDRLANRE